MLQGVHAAGNLHGLEERECESLGHATLVMESLFPTDKMIIQCMMTATRLVTVVGCRCVVTMVVTIYFGSSAVGASSRFAVCTCALFAGFEKRKRSSLETPLES